MKYQVKPLTEAEQKRWTELKFYLVIRKLLEQYNHTAEIYEVIGTLGYLFNCNISILKYLVQNIENVNILLKPTGDECIILMYRKGVPVRKILELLDLKSMSTLYRAIDNYINSFSPEYIYRLLDEQHAEVTKFMQGLDKLGETILC